MKVQVGGIRTAEAVRKFVRSRNGRRGRRRRRSRRGIVLGAVGVNLLPCIVHAVIACAIGGFWKNLGIYVIEQGDLNGIPDLCSKSWAWSVDTGFSHALGGIDAI